MNVLNLHETVSVAGGAEVYIGQLQQYLAAAGHRSYWLGLFEDESGFTLTFSHTPDKKHGTLADIIHELELFIAEKAIDVVNIHSLFQASVVDYCLSAKPVVKFSHSPVIVCPGRDKFWRHSERICNIKYGLHCFKHIYTEGCANRHPKRVIKAWSYVRYELRHATKRYKKIIVMSDYMKNGLLECGVSQERICVNPYFTPALPKPVFVSNDSGQKRILFAGRLISSKGVHLLIEAVTDILRNDRDVCLDIIGEGMMKEQLMRQVADAHLEDQIIFHGWQGRDQINEFLSKCYMVAFPSIYPEAFGIVGIEAMMHGKPVVAFDVGGVPTWLRNAETGFLAARANVHEMSGYIKRILYERELHQRMSANAYDLAINRFTPDIHIDCLLDIYKSCLS